MTKGAAGLLAASALIGWTVTPEMRESWEHINRGIRALTPEEVKAYREKQRKRKAQRDARRKQRAR